MLYMMEDMIKSIRELFNNAKDLRGVIDKYINEHDSMKKQIEGFRAQATERAKEQLVSKKEVLNGINIVRTVVPIDPASAKDLVFKVHQAIPERLVCVLGSVHDSKPMLNVMVSEDLVKEYGLHAGQLVREAAKLINGGGGGQPHFASAGGKNPDGLTAAVEKVVTMALEKI